MSLQNKNLYYPFFVAFLLSFKDFQFTEVDNCEFRKSLMLKIIINQNELYAFHVLGIESSCDETAAAVLNDSGKILGENCCSQSRIHIEAGGVVPHVAQLLHKKNLENVVHTSMLHSKLEFKNLDAIAVTVKPGLIMSLGEGLEYAKKLCTLHEKPLIPIHHMEAHALTARMIDKVNFPFLVLLISGGHCILALAKSTKKYYNLGETIDITPGQVFDKVARRAKLINIAKLRGLVGGASIETAASYGDPTAISFPSSVMGKEKSCNFSFSGFITRAYYYIESQEKQSGLEPDAVVPNYNDLCASLQWGITVHLCQRLELAIKYIEKKNLLEKKDKCLVVSGGVASNDFIKRALKYVCDYYNYKIVIPPPKLCTDNGIMIAWNGIEKLKENCELIKPSDLDTVNCQAKCSFGEDISKKVTEELRLLNFKTPKIKFSDLLHEITV